MMLRKFTHPFEFWRNLFGFLVRKKQNSNNGNNCKDILKACSAELVFISVRTSTISYDGKIKNYQIQTDDFSHLQMCLSNIALHKCVHSTHDLCLIAIQVCSVHLQSDLSLREIPQKLTWKISRAKGGNITSRWERSNCPYLNTGTFMVKVTARSTTDNNLHQNLDGTHWLCWSNWTQ